MRHRYTDSSIYRFWKEQEANRLAAERLSDTAAKLTQDAMSRGAFVGAQITRDALSQLLFNKLLPEALVAARELWPTRGQPPRTALSAHAEQPPSRRPNQPQTAALSGAEAVLQAGGVAGS